jgi:hypothetical protein
MRRDSSSPSYLSMFGFGEGAGVGAGVGRCIGGTGAPFFSKPSAETFGKMGCIGLMVRLSSMFEITK